MVDMNVDAFDEAETELKFIATTDNGDVLWETGYNRTLAIPEMAMVRCVWRKWIKPSSRFATVSCGHPHTRVLVAYPWQLWRGRLW